MTPIVSYNMLEETADQEFGNTAMLADVLKRIKVDVPRVPMPAESYEFLRKHRVPEDIISDLAASSFATWVSVGPLNLVPMPELVEQNSHSIKLCIDNGYLAIAGGSNGDPVVVNCRTRRMAFVAHELLWSDELASFNDCVHQTPYDYEEFWEALESDENFPWDFYEAQERWPNSGVGPRLWRPDED